jgi:hypothetical protein
MLSFSGNLALHPPRFTGGTVSQRKAGGTNFCSEVESDFT